MTKRWEFGRLALNWCYATLVSKDGFGCHWRASSLASALCYLLLNTRDKLLERFRHPRARPLPAIASTNPDSVSEK